MNNRIKIFLNFLLKHNKLRTFLLFFVISSSLWLTSQMSKKYVYSFKIPVIYTNLPSQYYKGFLPNDTLQISLKTTGYQILKHKVIPSKLELDIQKYRLIDTQSWQPEKFKDLIFELFDYQGNILKITPSIINFRIKAVQKKQLPVKADLHLQYAPGFKNKKALILKPDSIWVYGDRQILDTLNFVATRHYVMSNIKKDVNKTLTLKKIERIKFNTNKVRIKIPVSEIVEESITLPVKIKGAPINANVLLFPEKIRLNYKFFKDDYKNLNHNDFRVEVTYNPKQKQWQTKLTKRPAKAFDFVIQPDKITYLIKQ